MYWNLFLPDFCANSSCAQLCDNGNTGAICSCNPGYVVNADNSTLCDDVDECSAATDPCSTIINSECQNSDGSYR